MDTLNPALSPVQFLASKFPGKAEQEYRSHLGNFQISGMTGYAHLTWCSSKANYTSCRLQPIGTLSGGQKSRVAFALLSLQKPHILLLDEVNFQKTRVAIYLIFSASSLPIILISRCHYSMNTTSFVTHIFAGSRCSYVCAREMEWWSYHHIAR